MRATDELLPATENPKLPIPVPAVDATEIQESLAPSVHEQPGSAVTVTIPEPPEAPNAVALAAAEYEHEEPEISNALDQPLGELPDAPTADTIAA